MKFKFEWVCPCLGEWQLWVDKYHVGTIFATEDDDRFTILRGNGQRITGGQSSGIDLETAKTLLERLFISDMEEDDDE